MNTTTALDLIKIAELDVNNYLLNPSDFSPEFFEGVQMALLEAIAILGGEPLNNDE